MRSLAGVLLLGSWMGAGPAAAQELRFKAEKLPRGWSIEREVTLNAAQIGDLERRLGVDLDVVRYQHLSVRGLALQVNLIHAADEAAAERLVTLIGSGERADYVARRGTAVVEFAKMNLLAAKALRHAIGLPAPPNITWNVSFRAACVETLDYMTANRVSNLCASAEESAAAEIRALTAEWKPGNTLRMRAPGPGFEARYRFEPKPVEVRSEEGVLVCRFAALPMDHGLPYVDVDATITVGEHFEPIAGERGKNPPAPRWLLGNDSHRKLGAQLIEGCTTDRERLLAVFDHVVRKIQFGGDIVGSRYGPDRVLEQGYGHCWDKSDAFVALCRAAGLRTRQVGGWVPAIGAGHIWSEVYLEAEGWLPVDATCPWLGISTEYVPWFQTNNGEMPIVYLTWPKVRREPPS